jgi:hypothetical protein
MVARFLASLILAQSTASLLEEFVDVVANVEPASPRTLSLGLLMKQSPAVTAMASTPSSLRTTLSAPVTRQVCSRPRLRPSMRAGASVVTACCPFPVSTRAARPTSPTDCPTLGLPFEVRWLTGPWSELRSDLDISRFSSLPSMQGGGAWRVYCDRARHVSDADLDSACDHHHRPGGVHICGGRLYVE